MTEHRKRKRETCRLGTTDLITEIQSDFDNKTSAAGFGRVIDVPSQSAVVDMTEKAKYGTLFPTHHCDDCGKCAVQPIGKYERIALLHKTIELAESGELNAGRFVKSGVKEDMNETCSTIALAYQLSSESKVLPWEITRTYARSSFYQSRGTHRLSLMTIMDNHELLNALSVDLLKIAYSVG